MSKRVGLEIQNLSVKVEDQTVVSNLSLVVPSGQVHAIMGPNGSGKSSLALAILGHPKYVITSGQILFQGKNILELSPDERARLGLFLSFQVPIEVPGLKLGPYLRTMMNAHRSEPLGVTEALDHIRPAIKTVGLSEQVLERGLNEGFSGGERKRAEILQLLLLQPSFAILDETDSGLDIDALRTIASAVNSLRSPNRSFLVITHYRRLLDHLNPDIVHVLQGGEITKSGGFEVVDSIEAKGYKTAFA